jgi:hypothetical protein
LVQTQSVSDFVTRDTQGVEMDIKQKVIVRSAAAAAVISVLVSVVGAGTKWVN